MTDKKRRSGVSRDGTRRGQHMMEERGHCACGFTGTIGQIISHTGNMNRHHPEQRGKHYYVRKR